MNKKNKPKNKINFEKEIIEMSSPTYLPEDKEASERWQKLNKNWWESHPMRYDWKEKNPYPVGSPEYFKEIDLRFFASSREYLPYKNTPFDSLIDFEVLKNKDVLEIGVGHGSHAALLASHCKSFTGIDLTEKGCQMTRKRFEVMNLQGNILQMDAEKMTFTDHSFDYIWSWGVIHHSANTNQILKEMARVLRPGGEAIVMVYHRSFWRYYIEAALIRGVFLGEFLRHRSLNEILQLSTDGASARYYKTNEWIELCRGLFQVESSFVCGQKTDLVLLPYSPLKQAILTSFPNVLARFFTNTLSFGSFLVVKMRKNPYVS